MRAPFGSCLFALCALSACGVVREHGLVRLSEQRLARARELKADVRAPLEFERFRAAKTHAEQEATDSEAHTDLESEARLWLETAIASAEASELRERRLELERKTVALDEAALGADKERLALEDQREREAAAKIAREEAERALSRAAEHPAQRTKLSAEDSRRAARSLLERAELVLLALPDAVDAEARTNLTKSVQAARDTLRTDPERALSLADQSLFRALALLSVLRTREGAPTPAERASLAEALELSGASVVRSEAGLLARLPARGTERVLERLCSLAQAYPQGTIELVSHERAPKAQTFARTLARAGCEGTRFRVAKSAREAGTALLFSGY